MNIDKNGAELLGSITMPMCDRTVSCEVSADITLPDYQPELRRLLGVSERILPPAKYVSGSGVECNGTVDYRILYVGADGGLYGTTFSSEYEIDIPIENGSDFELTEGACTTVCTVCEGSTVRVTSPRKINVKSRLRSHIRSYANMRTEENAYGEVDISSVEKLYGQVDNACMSVNASDVIEVDTEIGGFPDDLRVISADASVFVNDARVLDGELRAGGDVNLKLLVCREGREAETVTKKLHFDGELDGSDIFSDSLCRVVGNVTDMTVNVEEGRILCNISLVLDGICAKNRPWRYTADIYSTERECDAEMSELAVPAVIACTNGNFSQSERLPLSDTTVSEGSAVIDAWGNASLGTCEYLDGKYVFTGKSRYTLLCENEGEYSTSDVELPLRYELEGEGADSFTFDAFADVISCRARIDGDTLAIDAEIGVGADIFGTNNITAVESVRFGEPYGHGKSRMVVYYPAEGESPWDVAKKYHVPADTLTAEKHYYIF